MASAKYHHHYPRFLLRNWCIGDDKVWAINKRKPGDVRPSPQPTARVLGENHANSHFTLDGVRNNAAEQELAKVEAKLSFIAETIVAKGPLELNAHDLTGLFWNMAIRAPSFRKRHGVAGSDLEEHVVRQTAAVPEFAQLIEQLVGAPVTSPEARTRLASILEMGAFSQLWGKPIRQAYVFGFARVVAPKEKTFIVGANAIHTVFVREINSPLALLPIAPTVAIAPFSLTQQVVGLRLALDEIQAFNELVYANNHEVVSVSPELLTSLMR